MSLVEDVAALLRTSRETLPLDEVVVALDRLRTGTELLMRVRATAQSPAGVPQLGSATEHLEHAGRALAVAQEAIDLYLSVLGFGVGVPGRPVPLSTVDGAVEVREGSRPVPEFAPRRAAAHWWAVRVAALTSDDGPPGDGGSGDGASGEEERAEAREVEPSADPAGEPVELLVRVVRLTQEGADKRVALAGELVAVAPPVGLALAGLTPAPARRLATELLGHPPRPDDLARLSSTVRAPVAAMLPALPPGVVDTLLTRVCRIPAQRPGDGGSAPPPHPADAPVAGAVLIGALLLRLGRELDRRADLLRQAEPVAAREATDA